MNTNQFEGKWDQLKGQVQEKWGKLTEDDISSINGKQNQLKGKLKERYGFNQEQADREVESFLADSGCESEKCESDKDAQKANKSDDSKEKLSTNSASNNQADASDKMQTRA